MGLISLLKKSKPQRSFKKTISDIIGYTPKKIYLFERVFTHRSLEKVDDDGRKINYERLEFLGDAVLGTIIGNYLFSKMPDADEGTLTQMRSKIVRREFLNHVGKSLNLYPLLQSRTEKNHYGDDVHGNIFEALVGAVFVDGGFLKCRSFVETKIIEPYIDLDDLKSRVISYKGTLVNWFQKQKMTYEYDVFEDSGANKLMFKAKLFVNKTLVASAHASNKKKAAEKVSKRAYFKFANQMQEKKQNQL
ncbi:MAG: ribonuclease III domain-containing protein [Bacteroidota bacterium]|nr:ribonuclease III domain-containing protein [Bacteroidota bacterium]MEC8238587.1 ribonuclease III domain-containing protein [Bacteroidota bacterium]